MITAVIATVALLVAVDARRRVFVIEERVKVLAAWLEVIRQEVQS